MILAIVQDGYGLDPERVLCLAGIEVTLIVDGALVHVRATSVGRSPADAVETAAGGDRLPFGDEVFGVGVGSFAEYAVVPVGKLRPSRDPLLQGGCHRRVSGLTALGRSATTARSRPGRAC